MEYQHNLKIQEIKQLEKVLGQQKIELGKLKEAEEKPNEKEMQWKQLQEKLELEIYKLKESRK